MKLETVKCRYRVDRHQISFIKFILEAYDNMAVVSTVDAHVAVVQIAIAPGCESLVKSIMAGFPATVALELIEDAPSDYLGMRIDDSQPSGAQSRRHIEGINRNQ